MSKLLFNYDEDVKVGIKFLLDAMSSCGGQHTLMLLKMI